MAALQSLLPRPQDGDAALTHHRQRRLQRVHPGGFLHFALVSAAVGRRQQGDGQGGVARRGLAGGKAEAAERAVAVGVDGAARVRQDLMRGGGGRGVVCEKKKSRKSCLCPPWWSM